MVSSSMALSLPLVLSLALFVPFALGGVICEELPQELCAYAISSSSRRCVLETTPEGGYQCWTSAVAVRGMSDWIEADDCLRACGLGRVAVGLPTASAVAADRGFAHMLCSRTCYDSCPNIVDLYATLAAGEGVFLPKLCEAQQQHVMCNRRMMVQIAPVGSPVGSPAPL